MRFVAFAVVALLLVLALPGQAWAYIDPGASSMAYQVLVAGALALGFALRRSLRWLGGHFGSRRTAVGNDSRKSGPDSRH